MVDFVVDLAHRPSGASTLAGASQSAPAVRTAHSDQVEWPLLSALP